MRNNVYHVTDSDGRVTQVLKPTERAVRQSWKKHQEENQKLFGLPIRTIVSIRQVA